jgi:hypothetical protein
VKVDEGRESGATHFEHAYLQERLVEAGVGLGLESNGKNDFSSHGKEVDLDDDSWRLANYPERAGL